MANLQLELDALISKTNQLLCKDTLELEEDTNNANKEYPLTLLAKIISNKKVNAKAVQSILFKAWNPNKGMKIQLMEENCFCITFNHDWDRTRVLESRPWSIMSSHMVVRDWPPDLTLKEINFNLSPFWIRICGLPPNQMTKANATKITDNIGALLEVDFTANGKIAWCKYLRIRVKIDVRKPIQTAKSPSDLRLPTRNSHALCKLLEVSSSEREDLTITDFEVALDLTTHSDSPTKHTTVDVRGLGRASHVRALKKDIRGLNPDIIFLSETLSPSSKLSSILNILSFYRFCCVPSTGSKRLVGGLCLAWKEGIDLEISFSSQNIVNALVFSDPPDNP
ncbi:hypothetical protein RJ639_016509 [Escallonia herrerae]|uniref:DUF4283 domain-containing protein n=1 Tax=Escallonia herrerae TaxID=1293975 RepID=A0AA88VBB8_9ASTE|nr:hypothetical protein RJ639_016509 [Escallonia herrerae]